MIDHLLEMKEQLGRIEATLLEHSEKSQRHWEELKDQKKDIKKLEATQNKQRGAIALLILISIVTGILASLSKLGL